MTDDPKWGEWSSAALVEAQNAGPVVINPLIHAEVSVGFSTVEELDAVLPHPDFEREPLPYEAGFLAGKAFLRYRRQGGAKQTPLPDFSSGAHAAIRSYRLLTRDVARYRAYFPTVELVCPPD